MKLAVGHHVSAPDGGAGPTGRAGWHRRAGMLPLAYLVALVAVALIHPFLPSWRWLAIHLLLLGAVTNAIMIWSPQFTAAVLRAPAPAPAGRRGEALRLALLNVGVVGVLAGGAIERPGLGVAGAVLVFAAVSAHLLWLVARVRAALPARFASPCTTTSPLRPRCWSVFRSARGCSSSTTTAGRGCCCSTPTSTCSAG